ncbi:hypothetical protein EJB05_12540, partial [Eragrostis curvula]
MEATQASGAGVGVQAGGSRSEEVRSRVTGQGGVVPGGGPRSGPARGVEIHGGGTRGAGATNNGGRLRREERLRHGITEGPDATHNAQQAGLADHLPANNEDHVE